jgi:hypothetical protein
MLVLSLHTGARTVVPFSTMVRADSVENGWRVVAADGDTHRVSEFDWKYALQTTVVSTFPAAPGTSVLWSCENDDGPKTIERTVVLGWGVYADGNTRPLTLDSELDEQYFVEHPDGHVECSYSLDRWPSAQAWFDAGAEAFAKTREV